MTDWGPWTDHTGTGSPIPDGTEVMTIGEWPCGTRAVAYGKNRAAAPEWDWSNYGTRGPNGGLYGRVLRYRVRRSPAVLALVQMAERVGENA